MSLSQKILFVISRICKPVFRILFSWKVEGRENIPLAGPLILITNHVNLFDPFFLLFSFPRWISFMAKEELFRSPFLRPWLRWAGSLSISRRGKVSDKQKMLRSARDALEKGLILGMFPEGGRSRDGKLREGKSGSAVIASKTNVPLLPVGIAGTDNIKGISWLWKRPRIVVNIGKPLNLPPNSSRMSKSQMQLLTRQLMREIAALLPPEYQGAYGKHEDREG
jgi:1-acyl-sn-glycerol-3-phosphate acyltransferase